MSTTLTCRFFQSSRWLSRLPTSLPRIRCATWRAAACSRRSKAATVPCAAGRAHASARLYSWPSSRSVSASTSASKPSMRRPSISIQGSRASPASAAQTASFASMRSTTKLSWLEASSDSANRKRSRRSVTTSRTVQKKDCTPSPRLPVVREPLGRALPDRREDLHARERLGGKAHLRVGRAVVGREPAVLLVEEQQVLALHVEDERVRVRGLAAEGTRGEEAVEQERRVARLGGDAGDARDADVGAARAVEEVEVREDGLAVAREADRQPPLHAVEEERLVAARALGPAHLAPGQRRHEDLGLDARHLDVRGLRHDRRQHALLDQEHVGVELGALVARAHQVDDAVEPDLAAVGQLGHDLDHVVELQVLPRLDRHPELERHRVLRPEHAAESRHAVTSASIEALRLDGAPDHRGIAQPVLQLGLEPADRVEVLRRARVARRVGGEARQEARRQVGELSRLVEAARGRGLEPGDARELGLDGSAVSDAQVPGVARVAAGDQEDRRSLADREPRQQRLRRRIEIRCGAAA